MRRSPLGEEANSGNIFGTSIYMSQSHTQLIMFADSTNASHWTPILLLADLYSQALLTMGDDEFLWSSSSSTSSSRAVRNPLTLDEFVSFSKRLLNIAFTIWRDDQSIMHEVFMGDGKREGDEVFVGYPCERVSGVRLFLSNSSTHNGAKFTQTICTCGSLAHHIPARHELVRRSCRVCSSL